MLQFPLRGASKTENVLRVSGISAHVPHGGVYVEDHILRRRHLRESKRPGPDVQATDREGHISARRAVRLTPLQLFSVLVRVRV